MERHYWIDMVKGLTIILVVFHHGFMGVSSAGLVSGTLMNFYSLTKPIRMPLFFMVSGFLLLVRFVTLSSSFLTRSFFIFSIFLFYGILSRPLQGLH